MGGMDSVEEVMLFSGLDEEVIDVVVFCFLDDLDGVMQFRATCQCVS